MTTAAAYVDFGVREARGVSPVYERLSLAVSRDADRSGLGVVDMAVREVAPQPVRLTVHMVTSDGEVVLAAVRYDARARIVTADGVSGDLHQRARMVFVPHGRGWRADVVEADLTLPTPEEADR